MRRRLSPEIDGMPYGGEQYVAGYVIIGKEQYIPSHKESEKCTWPEHFMSTQQSLISHTAVKSSTCAGIKRARKATPLYVTVVLTNNPDIGNPHLIPSGLL